MQNTLNILVLVRIILIDALKTFFDDFAKKEDLSREVTEELVQF